MKPVLLALLILAAAATTAAASPGFPYPQNVQVFAASCPGYTEVAGCTFQDGRIYVPAETDDPGGYGRRAIVLHELGHAFLAQMPHWARHRFRVIYGHRRMLFGMGRTLDERFADAYANCAIDAMPTSDRFLLGYGYEPSRKVHREVCALIRRTGRSQAERDEPNP